MATRRSYGTGSLVERPPGSGKWMFRFVLGIDPVTNKVDVEASRLQRRTSLPLKPSAKDSVRSGSSRYWNFGDAQSAADGMDEVSNRSRTISDHAERISESYRHHIKGTLGNVKISDLTPHQLDTLYGKSSSAGKSRERSETFTMSSQPH